MIAHLVEAGLESVENACWHSEGAKAVQDPGLRNAALRIFHIKEGGCRAEMWGFSCEGSTDATFCINDLDIIRQPPCSNAAALAARELNRKHRRELPSRNGKKQL